MRNLLVAVDFAPGSRVALEHARALGVVQLLHVARSARSARTALPLLDDMARDEEHGVRTGSFVRELLAAAALSGSDAIVLGAATRRGVARALLLASPVPVLLPRGERPARVVVAVDFSEATRAALPVAFDLAEERGLPLVLLHASGEPAAARAAVEESVRSLAKLALERDDLGGAVVSIAPGEPVAALLAATGPGDLVVCGTKAHSRLEELLLGGGVARRLIAAGRASVLVVGPGVARCAPLAPTTLRQIRVRHVFTPAGRSSSLYAECARRGGALPLGECSCCGSFAGLLGHPRRAGVVRCRDETPVAAPPAAGAAALEYVCLERDLARPTPAR